MSSHTLLNKGILYSFITMILWALHDVMARYFAVQYDVRPFIFICFMFFVGASFGVTMSSDADSAEELLKKADELMYRDKESSR